MTLVKSLLICLSLFTTVAAPAISEAQGLRKVIGTRSRVLKIKQDISTRAYEEIRPGVTQDGTVNEEQQNKSLAPSLGRTASKDQPSERSFDFSIARKVIAELKAQGWRPLP